MMMAQLNRKKDMKIVKIKDWIEAKYSKTKYRFLDENKMPYLKKSIIFSINKIYIEEVEKTCYLRMDVEFEEYDIDVFVISVPKIYLTYNNQPSLLLEIAKTLFGFEEIF